MRSICLSAVVMVGLVFAAVMTPAWAAQADDDGFHVMEAGDVRVVVVDNRAVDNEWLPGHRAGYSGVASLTHSDEPTNLFVPNYAGLNYEHIHDGTTRDRDVLFEPRRAAMGISDSGPAFVELHQPPTPTWKLESTTRYELLEDGTIEMTFRCIPREATFRNGYIGLFWASYINQPESLDIHYLGESADVDDEQVESSWVRGVTPSHGVLATHVARRDNRRFEHDDDFPLSLVFNRSEFRYDEPWYYGVRRGMALIQVFRSSDQIRFSQSPSGGGQGNPAWDFQFMIDDYELDKEYGFVMRAVYVPYESPEQIAEIARRHAAELNGRAN